MSAILCVIEFFYEIFKNFASGIIGIFKSKHKLKFIGFIIAIILTIAGFLFTEKATLERTFFVLGPIPAFIFFLGSGRIYKKKIEEEKLIQEIIENDQMFERIGFKSKNGEYPLKLDYEENDIKGTYTFDSAVPLYAWQSNKDELEVALNKIICKISQHPDSKQMVLVETLPAKYKLDTFIKWNDKYINKNGFTLVLGKSYDIVAIDLERDNHLLIGGCTNIGKSVVICCIVYQCIVKRAKIFLFDFKFGIEFNKEFEKFGEVVTKRKRALEVLQELTKECEKRGNLLREHGAKKLSEYNKMENVEKLSRIVLFCDEIGELLDTTAKDNYEKKLCNEIISEFSTIARTGRALGIHMIGAMQKVDANILTGQIKSNMQRVTGALKDSYAIKQFLGVEHRVENFIPGRFLYRPENEIVSFQAFYFDSDKLKKIKNYEPDGIVLVEQDEKPKLELVKDDPVDEDVEADEKSKAG